METDTQRQPGDILQQGLAHHRAGHLEKAKALYQRVLEQEPRNFNALNLMGALLQETDPHAALRLLDQALTLNPQSFAVHFNRGLAFAKLERWDEALESYTAAAQRNPGAADIHGNRGVILFKMKRYGEALDCQTQALRLQPDFAAALVNRGNVLRALNQNDAALADYERAAALQPDLAEAHNNRAAVLTDLGKFPEALASYQKAVALRPDFIDALAGRSDILLDLKRTDEAAKSYAELLAVKPDYPFAKGRRLLAKMSACDWSDLESLTAEIRQDLRGGVPAAEPFGYQAISESESDLLRCAEIYAARTYPVQAARVTPGHRRSTGKIRLGYVSGEFRNQATSILMAEVWELHDQARFEIYAFDNGWDDNSNIRRRINAAFHEIVDISRMDDAAAATAVQTRDIDILINLNGYFGKERQAVFAMRPAPVQVNYLGFPGTLGADYFDYLIADRTVIPETSRRFYTERVVYLPQCYQANDRQRRISDKIFTRAELGLPQDGFVFCCFNNNYKITPRTFDSWMRILKAVDGSVLWLLEDTPVAARNLHKEATARGVAPERLVFAPRMVLADHLARHRAADLFLDTWPYNAHTTASDALWAGLPLLTLRGSTFPGRVAASLLTAAGLPELIAETVEEYEAMAVELAGAPKQFRTALSHETCALFDTPVFTQALENTYAAMIARNAGGL